MSVLPVIKPMLAAPPKRERPEHLAGTHAFDLKLDGIRAVLYWDGATTRVVNRSMKDITHRFPEIEAALSMLTVGHTPFVIDGEIVADSGSFQDTARRDKQNKPEDVARWMHEIPVRFVTFDMLISPDSQTGIDVRNQPYSWRRQRLEMQAAAWKADGADRLTTSVVSLEPSYFQVVKDAGLEGVIAKRLNSPYRTGARHSDWTKFKAVRSITCVGIGYEKGEGARAHFGAMFLALISPDGPVEVGRVGTGFTASEIDHLKTEMDAGHPVVVEIECLNKSKDGKLRFPVYKGLRTDLSVQDATLAQLDQIPTM